MTNLPMPDPAPSSPLLRLEKIGVDIERRSLLDKVDLNVAPGEVVTLVGPNGGGKSTLLRVVIGDVAPTQGTLWRRPGLGIGYMPQKLAIDSTMPISVRRFVQLGAPPKAGAAEVNAALDRVNALRIAESQMHWLSGGETQRVLLARAMIRRPGLLVLDEPTQGLDQSGAAMFYRLIDELRQETGAAVLLASHDLHVVMAASNRVLCVNGHICCQGAPEHVSAHPEYRALFGQAEAESFALYHHQHDHKH